MKSKLVTLVVLIFGAILASDCKGTRAEDSGSQDEENKLIEEIANIIAEDVITAHKKLGTKRLAEGSVKYLLKGTAMNTVGKVEPLMERLAKVVADPKHAVRNIVGTIKKVTARKVLKNVDVADGRSIRPRSLDKGTTGITGVTWEFVNLVLNNFQ